MLLSLSVTHWYYCLTIVASLWPLCIIIAICLTTLFIFSLVSAHTVIIYFSWWGDNLYINSFIKDAQGLSVRENNFYLYSMQWMYSYNYSHFSSLFLIPSLTFFLFAISHPLIIHLFTLLMPFLSHRQWHVSLHKLHSLTHYQWNPCSSTQLVSKTHHSLYVCEPEWQQLAAKLLTSDDAHLSDYRPHQAAVLRHNLSAADVAAGKLYSCVEGECDYSDG